MILRDLDIKIERNPVAHVFSSDFAGCSCYLVWAREMQLILLPRLASQLSLSNREEKPGSHLTQQPSSRGGQAYAVLSLRLPVIQLVNSKLMT